ncbi:MAG: proton-conducting transporter membrane subunit, partial [Nitrospinota bacterium]|nr:proton-conducting transporter membrane subunit [Nitrospinota bacterium]
QVRPAAEMLNIGLLPIVLAAMIGVLMARDMVCLALMWELMALGSFLLMMHHYEDEETQRAGYIYLVYSQAGALFLIAALGVWAAGAGTFAFDPAGLDSGTRALVFFLALAAFGSKAGLAPLHMWLPHAHPAAPSHVSALMSGALIKMGVYGVLRFYLVLTPVPYAGLAALALGCVTALLGALYALGQADMKRAMAYSSVENIGIIFLGAGLGMIAIDNDLPRVALLAFIGVLMHVWNHSLFKALLFMAAGAVDHMAGTRRIDQLGGLLRTMPITGAIFLAGALAISGLPPMNGFAGEFFIYMAGFHGARLEGIGFLPFTIGVVVLATAAGLALACFTRLFGIAFLGQPRAGLTPGECPSAMRMAMTIPAALCAILGAAPWLALPWATAAARAIVEPGSDGQMPGWTHLAVNISWGAMAMVMVFMVIYLARRMLREKVVSAPTWGCGFANPTPRMQYTGLSFAAPILKFQRIAAPVVKEGRDVEGLFPSPVRRQYRIVDLVERTMGQAIRPVEALLERLRWIQHGKIHIYIAYIVVALAVLILAMAGG